MSPVTNPTVFSFNPGHFDFSLVGLGGAMTQVLHRPNAIRVPGWTEGRDAFVAKPLPTAPSITPHVPPFWFRRTLDREVQGAEPHAGAGLADSPRAISSAVTPCPDRMELKVIPAAILGVENAFRPAVYVPDHLKPYTTGEKEGAVHTAKGTVRAKDIFGIGKLSWFKERIIALAKEHQVGCRVDCLFDHLSFEAFAKSERAVNRFCEDVYRKVEEHNANLPVIYYGPSLLDRMLDGLGNLWHNLFTRRF